MNEEQHSSFRDYVGVLKRSAWIVVLAAVLATASAYLISARQTKMYSAAAEVLVPPAPLNLVLPGGNSSSTVQQARDAATLAQLAETPDVAAGAIGGLHPAITAAKLVSITSVVSDPSTNVLTFTVRNASAAFATTAVNAYAHAFATYENAQRVKAINSALASIAQQVAQTKRDAATAGKSQQFTFAQTLAKLASKQEALSTAKAVTLSAPATLSKQATGARQIAPTPSKDALLGLAGGLILGLGLATLRQVLDTKVRTADDVAGQIDQPLLARLSTPTRGLSTGHGVAVLASEEAALGEEYRKLRLSVEFANLGPKARSIVVTSSIAGEGKSTTVANLGAAFALAGKRVVIVDLDLRRPQLGLFFDIGQAPGMTEVLLGHATLDEALVPVDVGEQRPVGRDDVQGSLHVMHAGPVPPNPASFTESSAVGELLAKLLDIADLVLLDSAPLLPVGDTIGLVRHVDAMIVLTRAGVVTRPVLKDLRRTLEVCETVKLGFIFTGADTEPGYGYSEYYGSHKGKLPPPIASPAPAHHSAGTAID